MATATMDKAGWLRSPTFVGPVVVLSVAVLVLLIVAIVMGVHGSARAHSNVGGTLSLQGPVLAGSGAVTIRVQDSDPKCVGFRTVVTTPSGSPVFAGGSHGSEEDLVPLQAAQQVNGLSVGDIQISALSPNTTYVAAVSSLDASGKPIARLPLAVTFKTAAAGTPDPVTNVVLTQVASNPSDPPDSAAFAVAWKGASSGVQYLLSFTTPMFGATGVSAYGINAFGPGPDYSVGIFVPVVTPEPMPVTVFITPINDLTNVAGPPYVSPPFVPKV